MASQRHVTRERPGPVGAPHGDPILDAAFASIMDIGLRRTTVAEVSRRAGVSRMTVYRQYGDLVAVVGALLTSEMGRLVEAVRTATAGLPTARERTVESTVQVVSALRHHPLLRRVLDLDPESLLPYITDRLGSSQRAVVGVLAEEIAAGQVDGSVRKADARLAALILEIAAQSFVFSGRIVSTEAPADVATDPVLDELRLLVDGYLRP